MAITEKKNTKRNSIKKKSSFKEYLIQKLEKLSWQMGKKDYTKRAELYDR